MVAAARGGHGGVEVEEQQRLRQRIGVDAEGGPGRGHDLVDDGRRLAEMQGERRQQLLELGIVLGAPAGQRVAAPQLAGQGKREEACAHAGEVDIVRRSHLVEDGNEHLLVGDGAHIAAGILEVEVILVGAHARRGLGEELAEGDPAGAERPPHGGDALEVLLRARRAPLGCWALIAAHELVVVILERAGGEHGRGKVVGADDEAILVIAEVSTGTAIDDAGAQAIDIVLEGGVHQSTERAAADGDIGGDAPSLHAQEVLDERGTLLGSTVFERGQRHHHGNRAGELADARVARHGACGEHEAQLGGRVALGSIRCAHAGGEPHKGITTARGELGDVIEEEHAARGGFDEIGKIAAKRLLILSIARAIDAHKASGGGEDLAGDAELVGETGKHRLARARLTDEQNRKADWRVFDRRFELSDARAEREGASDRLLEIVLGHHVDATQERRHRGVFRFTEFGLEVSLEPAFVEVEHGMGVHLHGEALAHELVEVLACEISGYVDVCRDPGGGEVLHGRERHFTSSPIEMIDQLPFGV